MLCLTLCKYPWLHKISALQVASICPLWSAKGKDGQFMGHLHKHRSSCISVRKRHVHAEQGLMISEMDGLLWRIHTMKKKKKKGFHNNIPWGVCIWHEHSNQISSCFYMVLCALLHPVNLIIKWQNKSMLIS